MILMITGHFRSYQCAINRDVSIKKEINLNFILNVIEQVYELFGFRKTFRFLFRAIHQCGLEGHLKPSSG